MTAQAGRMQCELEQVLVLPQRDSVAFLVTSLPPAAKHAGLARVSVNSVARSALCDGRCGTMRAPCVAAE